MGAEDRNIILPRIRQLDESAVNRIAAGEVVERPASAVKELVENALDARAKRITVDIADGGRTLIRVTDDGHGITAADLPQPMPRFGPERQDRPVMAVGETKFHGEPVAAVVAETKDIAAFAAGLVEVDYDALPALTTT
ncbi:MAG: ATP-binding protein, partial [Pseudomonadota bacterium]